MPLRSRRALARDAVALALLVAVVAGGLAWRRASVAARTWQTVTLPAEGVRFRIPPGWRLTPLGYADPVLDAGKPGGGLVLAVRSFAIPPEMRQAAGDRHPERVALDDWADAQRSGLPQGQRLLAERRLRIDGARGALFAFVDRRDALPLSVVAAAAHDGRLYSFQAQAGPALESDDAVRAVRRILETVEWLPRAPGPVGQVGGVKGRSGAVRSGALQR